MMYLGPKQSMHSVGIGTSTGEDHKSTKVIKSEAIMYDEMNGKL